VWDAELAAAAAVVYPSLLMSLVASQSSAGTIAVQAGDCNQQPQRGMYG
jgi:hypothetical protein